MGVQFSDAPASGNPVQGCQTSDEPPPDTPKRPTHFIEVVMVFEDNGQPAPGEEYLIVLPDGTEVRGNLDANGFARVDGIENAGNCRVSFPKLDETVWSP